MATKLQPQKELKRETNSVLGRGKHSNKPLVIILGYPNLVTIQVKGTRMAYTTDANSVLHLAMKQQMQKDYDSAVETYRQKKKAGVRCKKPVKPFIL